MGGEVESGVASAAPRLEADHVALSGGPLGQLGESDPLVVDPLGLG